MKHDEVHAEIQGVIKKTIYLKVLCPEYLVVLPPVFRAASFFHNETPDKPYLIIVAVYRLAEAGYGEDTWNKYDFVGVEVR